MGINKDELQELVGVFYRNTFKTFYINSEDGESFSKPEGIFVSLGITTSPSVLEDIKNILISNGYTAEITKIASRKIAGQFLNSIIRESEYPTQFEVIDHKDFKILSREESLKRLEDLRVLVNPDQNLETLKELVPKISRLEELINKLDRSNGWEIHYLQETDHSFNIYHRFVNYKKEGDIEYRIGIYVSKFNK